MKDGGDFLKKILFFSKTIDFQPSLRFIMGEIKGTSAVHLEVFQTITERRRDYEDQRN